jgi:hypothetical protein
VVFEGRDGEHVAAGWADWVMSVVEWWVLYGGFVLTEEHFGGIMRWFIKGGMYD